MNGAALLLGLASLCFQVQDPTPAKADPVAQALARLGVDSLAEATAALDRAPDAEDARALALLGDRLLRTGDLAGAELLIGEALRMRRSLFGETDRRTLFLVHNQVKILGLQGRFAEAVALGEETIELVDAGPEPDAPTFLVLLNNHAVNLQGLGALSAAEEGLRRALDLVVAAKGPKSAEYATQVSNLANVLGDLGRLREARELAQEALELRIELFGENSVEVARAHLTLGNQLEQAGEFSAAEEHLRRAESLFRTCEPIDQRSLSHALTRLGELALSRGDPLAAEAAYREARTRAVAAQGPAHPDVVACDRGLALALLLDGRAQAALTIFRAAADSSAATFGADSDGAIQARTGEALALERTGDVTGAVERLRALVEGQDGAARGRPELAASLRSNLARCLLALGESEAAEEQLQTAIARIGEQFGNDSVFLAQPMLGRALLLEERGELVAAEQQVRAAMAIAAAQRDRVLGADVERSLFSAQLGFGDMGRLLARLRIARGDVEGALAALEETRARTLLDGLLRARRFATAGSPNDDGEAWLRLLQREEDARAELREIQARASSLTAGDSVQSDALQERSTAARNALGAATAALGLQAGTLGEAARPAQLARIRASLEPGEVLISFLWSESQVAWIGVGATSAESAPVAGTCARGPEAVRSLEAQVHAFARALATDPRRRDGVEPQVPAVLAALGSIPELHGARRVYVVPDGPLSSVPFEMFMGDSVRAVIMLPSAATLVALTEQRAPEALAGPPRAIVLGDPQFGDTNVALARSGRELARLPATRAEAEYVGLLLAAAGHDVRLLTGAQATRGELEGALGRVAWLHLATHGFAGTSAAPFDAALALAAEDAGGALSLDRLIRRWPGKLQGCELVVLSACETHREVHVGTGVYSLAAGFFQAGAQSVLASLWRVDEQATALLMGRFVENLTGLRAVADGDTERNGRAVLPRVQALREAQAWLRSASRDDVRTAAARMGLGAESGASRGAAPAVESVPTTAELRPYADPYFWAGFVLVGAAR